MTSEGIRFTDILTTASAIANYLGVNEVVAAHLLKAIAILDGTKTMDELGRPVSPLVPRPRGGPSASSAVREFAQRWFAELGSDPLAEIDADALAQLQAELAGVEADVRAPLL
jgi:hypothetical protein